MTSTRPHLLIAAMACAIAWTALHCEAASMVDSITTDPPGAAFDNTVNLTSVTIGGDTFSNLVGPSAAATAGTGANDFFWGSNGAAVEPLTANEAIGGLDLSTGILNPGNTSQGAVNVIFPTAINDANGGLANIFVFNPDSGGPDETWTVEAIIGGDENSPILSGDVFSFGEGDLGDTLIDIAHQRNSGGNFTQSEFGIGIDLLGDLNVSSLIGLQINTPNGDPSVVAAEVAVPEPASIALWTLLGLAACGYAYRRRRKVA